MAKVIKRVNYGDKEKTLERCFFLLYGTKRLRDGKINKVFCASCEYSNDEICYYDQIAKDGKIDTKYPCGKALVKYQSKSKK